MVVPADDVLPRNAPYCDTTLFFKKKLTDSPDPSVRIRRELQGHGAGLWHYNPEPLKGWECLSPGAKCPGIDEKDAELSSYRWTSNVNGDIVIIPEEKLGEYELELLKLSPEVYDRFTW